MYYSNADCEWLVKAPTAHQKVIINIEDVAVEGIAESCEFDYLAVYDGGRFAM